MKLARLITDDEKRRLEKCAENPELISNNGLNGRDGVIPVDWENRLNDLESTQYVVKGNIRVFNTRKWEGSAFAQYNTGRAKVDIVGACVTFKMGKSYEERKMAIQKALMDNELQKIKEQLKNQGIFVD